MNMVPKSSIRQNTFMQMSPHTSIPKRMCAVKRNNLIKNSERKCITYSNSHFVSRYELSANNP